MRVVVPPTTEPVTLEEARLQCSIDAEGSPPSHPADPMLERLITASRERCEMYLGRAIAPQTIEYAYDEFPAANGSFEVHYQPLLAVDSIWYYDSDMVSLMLDPSYYTFNVDAYPGRIILNTDLSWPIAYEMASAVRVRYVAGYAAPGTSPTEPALPAGIKTAILLMVATMWKNRENLSAVDLNEIPMGVKFWLAPYKLTRGFA